MSTIFLSYSHVDRDFALRLHAALREAGKAVWVDEEDIPPTARWADDIRSAIEGCDAFVFVISDESVASGECLKELEHAVVFNKRIIPLNLRPVEIGRLPEALALALAEGQFVPDRGAFEDDFAGSLSLLTTAVDTDLDWVREHTQWGLKALEWSRHDRDRSFLLSGKELNEAEAWVARGSGRRPEPTYLQNAYVLASRQGSTRRQRRLLGGVSLALVVALILGLIALVQRNTAVSNEQTAQSRQLSANAETAETSDPELSTSLALQALHIRYTSQAETALRQALPNFQVLKTFREPGGKGVVGTFSPDGSQILTAGSDGIARVHDASTGRQVLVLREPKHQGLERSGFNPDGSKIVTSSDDGTARIWNAATGHQLVVMKEPGGDGLGSAAFSPDGTKIVTASADGTARVWDAINGSLLETISDPGGSAVRSAQYSPDGSKILTVGADGTVRLWSAADGSLLESLASPFGSFLDASFNPQGSQVATVSGFAAFTWNASTGAQLHEFSVPGGVSCSFSPDGEELLTSEFDGSLAIWNPNSESQTASTADESVVNRATQVATFTAGAAVASEIQFNQTGTRILSTSVDGSSRIWAVAPREIVRAIDQDAGVSDARFSAHEKEILTADADGTARLWDAGTGALLRTLREPQGAFIETANFNPDDKEIVTASSDGTARVWNVASGHQLLVLKEPSGQFVTDASFSPDGSAIVTTSLDGSVRIWSRTTGKQVLGFEEPGGGGLTTAAFNRDGNEIVTASQDGTARILSIKKERETGKFDEPGGQGVRSAAFSPNASLVVTTSYDGTIRIWNALEGKDIATMTEPSTAVLTGAAFSPDGTKILSTSVDGTARIWGGPGFKQLTVFSVPSASTVEAAEFSPNGSEVVTASDDGVTRVWSTELDRSLPAVELIAQAWLGQL